MREATRAAWCARVEAWRKSGQTAAEFAADKPYKGTTLVWRAWQLRQRASSVTKRGRAKPLAAKKTAARIALAEVVRKGSDESASARVTVEVVGARIAVNRGFDPALLREIVQALRGGR